MADANPSCPQCGSLNTKLKYFQAGLAVRPKANFAPRLAHKAILPYRFWRCLDCDLCFNTAQLNEASLFSLYKNSMFADSALSAQAAQTYLRLLRPYLTQHGRFLDIGCSDAAFLNLVQQEYPYLELCGLEPAQTAIAKINPHLQATITAEPWERQLYPAHYFDYIMLAQTIEHLTDPPKKMQDILHWLRPGGKLIIFAHNYHAFVNQILGKRSPIYDAQHCQLYSPQALTYLCQGMKKVVLKSYVNFYQSSYLWALVQGAYPILQRFKYPPDLAMLKLPLPAGNIMAIFEQTSLLTPYPRP